jgi:hypothetical protein
MNSDEDKFYTKLVAFVHPSTGLARMAQQLSRALPFVSNYLSFRNTFFYISRYILMCKYKK